MALSYKADYPSSIPIDEGIIEFFETFYQISDNPDAHEKYADSFTKDATMIMASKKSRGRDEILATRKGMWEAVASRHHQICKIFPFGANATELMLYGAVLYVLKDGRRADVPWGARATMVKDGGNGWKMCFYQVYLDTAAMQNAN